MTEPVCSVRLSRVLKYFLGPAFGHPSAYAAVLEGDGEDAWLKIYEGAAPQAAPAGDEPEEEAEPPRKPNTAAGEDCDARLSPDGTHYIHAHDCQRAIELGLPRDPAPAEVAPPGAVAEPPFDPPHSTQAEEPRQHASPEMKGGRLSARAAMLCNEGGFQVFMGAKSREEAAELLRKHCFVTSRAHIDHDEHAASRLRGLAAEYDAWLRDE